MVKDLRLALRGLARKPGFAAVAIVTLALGIGATTAIFSVVNGVLLRSLAYPSADRLMQVETVFASGFVGRVSYPNFADLRELNRTFAGLAAYADWTTSAAAEGRGFRVHWAQVSADFFSVVGVEPALGRAFGGAEVDAGQPVAVVSYGYWQAHLGGRADLAGQRVRANDKVYTVVGVMPREGEFPSGTELWVPREPVAESRTAHNWSVLGRLRDGVPLKAAELDLHTIAERLAQQHGKDTAMTDAAVTPLLDRLVGPVRPALTVLLGAAGVLLLVACVNVANLLLTRAMSRDREWAVRLALGARPLRLARGFFAESLVLALAGASLGVLVALAGVPAMLALEPARLPRSGEIGVDSTVLAFALGAAALVALAVGLAPALRARHRNLRDALAGSQRVQGASVASRRLRSGLVVAQIALTIVLLVGAGLLGRSFAKLLAVNPGYRTDGALVLDLWFPEARDTAGSARIAEFLDRLAERLRALPGVAGVGGINHLPLDGGGPNGTFVMLERPDEIAGFADFSRLAGEPERVGNAEFRVASADYFRTMRIPLLRGRSFEARDTREAPHVALISESLARARWPDRDPLGQLIQFGNMDGDLTPFTIVGIVADVQDYGLGVPPRPTFYADYRQRPTTAAEFSLAIEGAFDVATTTAAARRIANELDAEVPTAFRALDQIFKRALADRRFLLLLLALFGGLALALATLGIYGVIGYLAQQRKAEIGVRVALGAHRGDVVRLLLRQGAVLAAAGVGVGSFAAMLLSRVLARFLYGVGAFDPATFATSAAVLFVAALAASSIPAYRAARVDALEALRQD